MRPRGPQPDNREIFNTNYAKEHVSLESLSGYNGGLVDVRLNYIEKYGAGADVLDVGCGMGAYSTVFLGKMKSLVGMDFSRKMLGWFAEKFPAGLPENLRLVEGDAMKIPLASESFDFVYSYKCLYGVPDHRAAINEIARVLRRGGRAALEMGNSTSLSMYLAQRMHQSHGWAVTYAVPLGDTCGLFAEAGLNVHERRSFQLLPMYGVPKNLIYMLPVAAASWGKVMGIRIGQKMIDEWVSGSWPLRYIAFRHFFLLEKT